MATTCRDVVVAALRRPGIVAAGGEPDSAMADEAMGHLQNLYMELLAQGVFGRMRDVRVTESTYTALEQDRISIPSSTTTTVTLPQTVTQEWVPDAGGFVSDYGFIAGGETGYLQTVSARPPRDQAAVVVVNICCEDPDEAVNAYVYDATMAKWFGLNRNDDGTEPLGLNHLAPLAFRYRGPLTALLAVRLADAYGMPVSDGLKSEAAFANSTLSHKWDRPRRQVVGRFY
jgi:hypothetical protein